MGYLSTEAGQAYIGFVADASSFCLLHSHKFGAGIYKSSQYSTHVVKEEVSVTSLFFKFFANTAVCLLDQRAGLLT